MKARTRVPVNERIRERIEEDFRSVEVMGSVMVIGGCVWIWLGLQIAVLHYQRGVFAGSYAGALSYHLPITGIHESIPGLFLIGSMGLGMWALLTCHALSRGSKHWGRAMMLVGVSFAMSVMASWTVYRSGDYLFGMAAWELEGMRTMRERSSESQRWLEEDIQYAESVLEAYMRSR